MRIPLYQITRNGRGRFNVVGRQAKPLGDSACPSQAIGLRHT
jgi:hypothetical protein